MKQVKTRILSLLLAFLLALPILPEPVQATEEELITTLSSSETDETQEHYFSYTAHSGKEWKNENVADYDYNESYIDLGDSDTRAEECYYEIHFTGHKIAVFANKAPGHSKVKFTVDGGHAQTVDLYNSTRINTPQEVYSVSGLSEGQHVLKAVTLNEKTGNTIVNQVAYAQIYQEIPEGEEPIITALSSSETDETQDHYFSYTAYSGKEWKNEHVDAYDYDESYIDLGSSDTKAEECYYEIHFTGHKIAVFANKAPGHSKVKFTVDGIHSQTVDLYNSTRINTPQEVYSVSGLTEGKHVLKAVTLNEKTGDTIVNQVAYAQIYQKRPEGDPDLGGSIEDTNWQYTNNRYREISAKNTSSAELHAWKNDKATSELVLYSKNCSLKNVSVTASALQNGTDTIAAENIKTTFIRTTKAYNGVRAYGKNPSDVFPATSTNRSDSSDILWQEGGSVDMNYNTLQPVWVEFNIPKDAKAGVYTTTLTATADGIAKPLTFTYTVNVQDMVLPDAETFKDTFDIELWQYPYVSAEYYGVEPFSDEHLKILESSMQIYKEIGGHAITASLVEDAWSGTQGWDTNDIPYPSMVKWTKNSNGDFTYDYSDFDKWVTFCKGLGIGDKIILYGVAPWHFSFNYWENGELKYEKFTVGSERYTQVWTDFLEKLISHLEEKGWFDDAYIGIDEKGFSPAAFDLVDSVHNNEGKSLKIAGAMDSFMENDKKDLAMRVYDLNVGGTAAWGNPTDFAKLLNDRSEAGLRTTLYSCTGHRPGNFSLSMPAESYWTIINAGKMGGAGFLRWAYDAWWQGGSTVGDPLNDTTHSMFEPGDTFLIFPDEKTAKEPKSRYSVRLARMAEGVRDVNKLRLIEKENPEFAEKIQELYDGIDTISVWNTDTYLTDAAQKKLAKEMTDFKAGIAEITDEYVESLPTEPEPITPPSQEPEPVTSPSPKPVADGLEITEGNVYEYGDYFYKVTSLSKKTVTVIKSKNAAVKKIIVPNTIKLKNITYKVTAIGDAAFQNYKQATSAKIGKNVFTIGRNAFAGCKKLKKINIKSKVLKSVGKTAFKGIHKKAQIKVPKKKLKKYKKILKKKGQGKKVKIK